MRALPRVCSSRGQRLRKYIVAVKRAEDLVWLVSQRAGRCLERLGRVEQDAESFWLDLDPAEETDAMPHLLGSYVSYRIAVFTP